MCSGYDDSALFTLELSCIEAEYFNKIADSPCTIYGFFKCHYHEWCDNFSLTYS